MISIECRQAHLAAMGIAQWYGRYTLIGAAGSPTKLRSVKAVGPVTVVVPERVAAVAPKELLTTVAPRREHAKPIVRAQEVEYAPLLSLGEQAQSGLSQQSIAVPTLNTLTASVAAQSVELAFKCYRAGQVLICAEAGREESAEMELALLANILRACRDKSSSGMGSGINSDQVSYKKSFHWPVFNCANLLTDDKALQAEFLARWLASLLSEQTECMLYFGVVNEHLLAQLLATVSASAGLSSPLFIVVGRSLSELIATPVNKAEVWSMLVPHLLRLCSALEQ